MSVYVLHHKYDGNILGVFSSMEVAIRYKESIISPNEFFYYSIKECSVIG
jgi:hypothetical protein